MGVSKPARASLRDWLVSGLPPAPPPGPAEARALFEEAGRQGLVGLLAAASGVLGAMEDAVRAEWRQAARSLLARGVHQLDLAGRILRRLEARGLRALPLKGAAVAEILCDSPADRAMADVDLLVLDDVARAARHLEDDGFRLVERADHALALRDASTGGLVELHRSVTSCPGLYPLDADGLWARREEGRGIVPWRPSSADLLVALSLHAAFQHGFGLSLGQFLDFRRLLERARPEPDRVLEAAASARAEGAVLLALAAARAVLGAEVPLLMEAALAERVPRSLRERAQALLVSDPLKLVAPERPSLLRARWDLARGRRLELVRRTLVPTAWPGEPRRRGVGVLLLPLRRAGRLLAREAALRRDMEPEPRRP